MAYRLTGISLETDTSDQAMDALSEVWKDILSGRLPLMHDSSGEVAEGLAPVTEFWDMTLDGSRTYPVTIRTVEKGFFADLQKQVEAGEYSEYEGSAEEGIGAAADKAWKAVADDAASGIIDGNHLSGYESTVPGEFTPDHKAHCWVYIRMPE